MRGLGVLALVAIVSACTDDGTLVQPTPEPRDVTFRVISEEQNAAFCVEGPEFSVVRTDDEWIEVYSHQSDCQPGGEYSLPRVRFDHPDRPEWVLAAWWRIEGCLGWDVETVSIVATGDVAAVRARSSGPGPGEACATALGGLESFIAVDATDLEQVREVRFELDGEAVGTVNLEDG